MNIAFLVRAVEGSQHLKDAAPLDVERSYFNASERLQSNDKFLHASDLSSSGSSHPQASVNDQILSNDRVAVLSLVAYFSIISTPRRSGFIANPLLPDFAICWRKALATSYRYPYSLPNKPRLSSPAFLSSEDGLKSRDTYLSPVARSITRATGRSQDKQSLRQTESGYLNSISPPNSCANNTKHRKDSSVVKDNAKEVKLSQTRNAEDPANIQNGHLTPKNYNRSPSESISRSQSPLGLIPIHQNWRTFVSHRASLFHQLELTEFRYTDMKFLEKFCTYQLVSSSCPCTVLAINHRR